MDTFEIKTPGVDVQKIMGQVKERVEAKRKAGFYQRYDLSAVTALELRNLATDEAYLDYYLKLVRKEADIDLGDFPIPSKTFFLGRPVVWLKKIIWKLLKFYTFRLFSQQKEFNLTASAILPALDRKFERRLAALEEKIDKLSKMLS